ncbi:MAG: endonuclease/exonuclease/phosphatase family protein [Acidobacteria bacterium]|nr:endonuclease/exonuclease/phosphatase family protein [Acidobacteriota bacterium]
MTIKSSVLLFLLLLLAFAGPAAARISSGRGALRVMTFNIRYNEPRDGVNAWSNRKTKVADVIRFHKADLIGLQEAQLNQLQDLAAVLPDFAWCGVGRDGGDKGEFSAILYRKSRFKLLETKTFWLSETPDKEGAKGWDADYPRIVTWARFEDRRTKKKFYHFNTHFDHRGEKARVESAKMLLAAVAKTIGNLPFVVTGDFNATEKTNVYRILTGAEAGAEFKLTDARYVSVNGHFGGTASFNEFKEPTPGYKIDYVFVGPGTTVFEHGILTDRWDGLWASDHMPVLAEIVFGKR